MMPEGRNESSNTAVESASRCGISSNKAFISPIRGIIRSEKATESAIRDGISSRKAAKSAFRVIMGSQKAAESSVMGGISSQKGAKSAIRGSRRCLNQQNIAKQSKNDAKRR